ncbi:MAG: glycylpeptide N-tetradecanoyltransferase [Lichina confinis]|nr:MAG: glycylpeptide N-tetradecanoyltransferase [Lichina confinis]
MADRSSQGEPKGVESSIEQNPSRPADAEASREHGEGPSGSQDAQVKKKSKRAKVKSALGIKPEGEGSKSAGGDHGADKKVSEALIDKILDENTAIEGDSEHERRRRVEEMLKKGDVAELLTGLAVGGKNQKDMASYKFWQTQPVPKFDEQTVDQEGPIVVIEPEKVSKEPSPLVEGFHWVTMDLTDDQELQEVYELLTGHYVEDVQETFRFKYSTSFLNWALKSPGWRKEWHVGVRATQSGKLVAFISGVPIQLRVRGNTVRCSEINYLCVHKKLRSKRLAPVLIKEITRRCNLVDIWQAIYTAGVILPKPISTCRYFHRCINWSKLYDVGFSYLPTHSTKARQVAKHNLPNETSLAGLRPMEQRDVEPVLQLLDRYLAKFDMAPAFTLEEIDHWLLSKSDQDQVVWTYVVEDPDSKKVTDFFSFYGLESSVIHKAKYDTVRAAYMFYYATEAAFQDDDQKLKARLNVLIKDALIVAKRYDFDVMNALTLLDSPLFLTEQKFGPGDGRLHYYLYNYRTAPIAGGVDDREDPDEKHRSGIGVVML